MNEKIKTSNREKQARFRESMKAEGWRRITVWTKEAPGSVSSRSDIVRSEHCQICGKKSDSLQFHHSVYEKFLEGVWVCKSCHVEADKRRKEREGEINASD
jgi:hypothetical protein